MGIYFATDIDRINNEYMPRLNLEIGRYINYSKLESMLSTQTLFFCNASRFDDEYEGEIPLEFLTAGHNNQKKTIGDLMK